MVSLLGGELIPWRRWWLPDGVVPTLFNGLLPDPTGDHTRFVNRDLVSLADSGDVRALVLLADSGMGKSTELAKEVERLRGDGHYVAFIDLGAYTSTGDIARAVEGAARAWEDAASPGDLHLVLDAFDEPLVDVVNLNDTLVESLGGRGLERLCVTVASRGSLWRKSLEDQFRRWWGADEVSVLHLAPLTVADVVVAAESEGLDGERFVDAVQGAGAGPLLARPITLRLLLAGARTGEMPKNRVEAYRVGVAGLADESGERRRERRRTGPSLGARLAAARRLAAASVLSGRPNIVRRVGALPAAGQVALDEVAGDAADLEAFDSVFDSALLSGVSHSRVWCHHSVAEYLCGEALAALPAAAAWSLLAAPGDPSTLRPQLEETAAWVATLKGDMFERLLDQHPRVLLKGDLGAHSPENRERVTRAVLARLGTDEPVLERGVILALEYPGVDDDLRRLIAADQPVWRRRETVSFIAAARYRDLDPELVDIVEGTAGETGYDPEVALSVYATLALSPVSDATIVERLRAVAADEATPSTVRAAVVTTLFPTHLTAADVAKLVPPGLRWSQPLGRNIVHALRQAVDASTVEASDVLVWFDTPPTAGRADDRARQLAAAASLAAVRAGPTGKHWSTALRVVAWLLDEQGRLAEWSPTAVDGLGPDRRRELARALLMGRNDPSMAGTLIERGILRQEDLLWWLDQLEADETDGDGGEDGGLSAGIVVRALAPLVFDNEEALEAARERCHSSPVLAARIGAEFEETTVDTARQWRADSERRRQAREQEQAELRFSQARLDRALAAGDLLTALEELDRAPAQADRPPGPAGPTSAWNTAGPDAQQETARLAAEDLEADRFNLDDYGDVHRLGLSIDVAAAAGGDYLIDVPASYWTRWLPALLQSTSGTAARLCLRRALAVDANSVAQSLETVIVDHVAGRGFGLSQWVLDELPAAIVERLAARAVALAAEPNVSPDVLLTLLVAGNAGAPTESARVAFGYLDARGTPPVNEVRRREDPAVVAWLRGIAAARALTVNPSLHDAFDPLLETFRDDPVFAIETIRSQNASPTRIAFQGLSSEQLADMYLWAKEAMPSRNTRPGVIVRTDRAEELPDDLIRILSQRSDEHAVAAMRRLAEVTGNVYLRESAERLAADVAADVAAPPSPQAVLATLDDPTRRAVTSTAQLAQVVLDALDDLGMDLARDRGLRRRLWERQRDKTRWSDKYVPAEETRVSQELQAELAARLRGRVAVVREVEIQPALGSTGADKPDVVVVALTTDTAAMKLPLEVKGNYNDDIIGALTTQLADRYLTGPVGGEGIYAVAYFALDGWDPADSKRRQIATRYSPTGLREHLERQAATVAGRGIKVHVRVIEIPLGSDELS